MEDRKITGKIYASRSANRITLMMAAMGMAAVIAAQTVTAIACPEYERADDKPEAVRLVASSDLAELQERRIMSLSDAAKRGWTDPDQDAANAAGISEASAEPIEDENTPLASGPMLDRKLGVNYGPQGKETWYNLDMSGVCYLMDYLGYSYEDYPYWVREDGVKMFGDYVMVAADLNIWPKGTILECSLGTAMVVDTGDLEPYQLDIAVDWEPED